MRTLFFLCRHITHALEACWRALGPIVHSGGRYCNSDTALGGNVLGI
jgi:hypothetical protein